MTSHPLDVAAGHVLQQFALATGACIPLGNRGGFSGARLWRVTTAAGDACLRAWPPAGPDRDRLQTIHRLMIRARQAGLDFIPTVFATPLGETILEHSGRLWDLTAWMPGQADFHDRPSSARLEAACTAVACLHRAWASAQPGRGPCPAISRRLQLADTWTALVRSGWRPSLESADRDPVAPWARRAWELVPVHLPHVLQKLAPWANRDWSLQPCLCDVWHDHFLFEGDTLTGLIDYGAMKRDHVAVDLARMLGSLVEDDPQQRRRGLAAYARVRPLLPEEEALVAILDESGTVLAATNWLTWIYHDGRSFEDRTAVAQRLAGIVRRIESWL